ncbi:MAG: ribonuclease activity regulator RraA [Planctomycetaceae bacterium]|jgi:regulator of RNase E activity RraA|nr:ribonuclease activity regulator RraA [Planctomycetaceae bacterium]MDP7276009.1 ribonuclease activity regulator RraA [Planctomycetaceae bacterium]
MNDTATETPVAIADRTWKLLEQPSTATLATVLAKHGLWNVFITGARPLSSGRRMVGQAYTLRYLPAREDLDHNLVFDNSTDPQRLAIESVGPGDVLVIDARGDERAGTMGNILATRMVARGAVGIVTDGCFRDSPVIAAMDIPAYARSAHAATNKTIHHPIDVQMPVGCGGVSVYPGDVLVGDDEGVVVIPRHLADEVALAAARQEHREDFILSKVENGSPLAGTYPPDEATQAEYEAYCRENPPPGD